MKSILYELFEELFDMIKSSIQSQDNDFRRGLYVIGYCIPVIFSIFIILALSIYWNYYFAVSLVSGMILIELIYSLGRLFKK